MTLAAQCGASDGSSMVGTLERFQIKVALVLLQGRRETGESWLKRFSDTSDWRLAGCCQQLHSCLCWRMLSVNTRLDADSDAMQKGVSHLICVWMESAVGAENWPWITRHIGRECVASGSRVTEKWMVFSDVKIQVEE